VPNPALGGAAHLSLYCRAADRAAADLLLDLVHELALTGFGADIATGRGQFEISGDPVPAPELDAPPEGANAVVVLSTFQPAPGDPADGYWELFPKFGKLGPDLGLPDVRKNTLIMFRPGACFRANPATAHLGRALPMCAILPEFSVSALRARGIEITHPAFGLCVPAVFPESLH
jgi:CRISPR-associated protein Csm4